MENGAACVCVCVCVGGGGGGGGGHFVKWKWPWSPQNRCSIESAKSNHHRRTCTILLGPDVNI